MHFINLGWEYQQTSIKCYTYICTQTNINSKRKRNITIMRINMYFFSLSLFWIKCKWKCRTILWNVTIHYKIPDWLMLTYRIIIFSQEIIFSTTSNTYDRLCHIYLLLSAIDKSLFCTTFYGGNNSFSMVETSCGRNLG